MSLFVNYLEGVPLFLDEIEEGDSVDCRQEAQCHHRVLHFCRVVEVWEQTRRKLEVCTLGWAIFVLKQFVLELGIIKRYILIAGEQTAKLVRNT